jgi:hypothetical protein
LRLMEVSGEKNSGVDSSILLSPAPKQMDLANRIGTTRETVARAFRKLTEEAIVVRVPKGLKILNPQALYAWAENIE